MPNNKNEARRKRADKNRTSSKASVASLVHAGFQPANGMVKPGTDIHYVFCRDITNMIPATLHAILQIFDKVYSGEEASPELETAAKQLVWLILSAPKPGASGRLALLRELLQSENADVQKFMMRFSVMFTTTIIGLLAGVPSFQIGKSDPESQDHLRWLARNAMFANLSEDTTKQVMRDLASIGDINAGMWSHVLTGVSEVLQEFEEASKQFKQPEE